MKISNSIRKFVNSHIVSRTQISRIGVISLVFSAFFIWSGTAAGQKPAKRLLLSIGISDFQSDYWKSLNYSHKDAKDIHQFFEETAFPVFDRAELLSPEGKYITKKSFKSALNRLQEDNLNSNDIVVIYVSTHGTIGLDHEGKIKRYIVTSDSDSRNLKDTSIPYEDLISYFRSLKSKKKVLILDFCHSGFGKSQVTPEMLKVLASQKSDGLSDFENDANQGEYILSASSRNEAAAESDRLKNGVYTHFLIEGFQKDANNDGVVTLLEAHNWARAKTSEFTSGNQSPTFKVAIEGNEPIYIMGTKPKNLVASIYSFWNDHRNYNLYVDGIHKGSLDKGAAVPSGINRIKIVDIKTGKTVVDRNIEFEEGKEYPAIVLFQKYYANHIYAGYEARAFASQNLQEDRGNWNHFRVGYTSLKYWNIFDLDISFSYGQTTDAISVSEFRQDVSRQREHLGVALKLGIHKPLPMFKSSNKKMMLNWQIFAGPKLSRTTEEISSLQFEDESWNSGAELSASLQAIFPIYGLTLNAGYDLEILENYIDTEKYATLHGFTISVGKIY